MILGRFSAREDLKLIPPIQVYDQESSVIGRSGGMSYAIRSRDFFNDAKLINDSIEACFDLDLRDGIGYDGKSEIINQSI